MEPEFPKFTGPHIIFVCVPSTLFHAAIQLNLYPFILTVMVTYSMIFFWHHGISVGQIFAQKDLPNSEVN